MSGKNALPTVAALGAGRMGRGIAHVFAYAGHPVILVDTKPRPRADADRLRHEALTEIATALESLAEIGAFDKAAIPAIIARIGFAARGDAPAALAAADIVFEGVPEVLELKREALDFASCHMRPDGVLASTTSTFLVDTLADFVKGRGRFLNAHWLNPAYVVPLVELSPGNRTEPRTTARVKALLEKIGKVPVICAAAPGFIVPRIQAIAMNEAARIVEEGLASAEDIDKATRYGFGFRYAAMGILEFIDYGGGDILFYASRYLAAAFGNDRYAAPPIIDLNMREGRTGLKSGLGFYDYSGLNLAAYRKDVLNRLVSELSHLQLLFPPGVALNDQSPEESNREDDGRETGAER